VDGEWTDRLSELAGHDVQLVRPDAVGETQAEPVTLLSDGSLARLEREAGCEVDPRRFRMLFTLEGCDEHEEDTWDGRLLRVGETLLRVGGPVDRCAVTTRDPESGKPDLDTLRLIKNYRGIRDGKHIDFVVSAGVEMMSRVPMGTSGGAVSERLSERWEIVPQGVSAEVIADEWGFSREELDAYSLESHRRALAAIEEGRFENEIVPIELTN